VGNFRTLYKTNKALLKMEECLQSPIKPGDGHADPLLAEFISPSHKSMNKKGTTLTTRKGSDRDNLIRLEHWQEDGKADPLFKAVNTYGQSIDSMKQRK
jgi:hypothetical protein